MAKGKKTGGGPHFAPGNPGGPGRPPLPPELKEARRLTKTEFERISNKYLWATTAELSDAMQDSACPAVERMLVSILFKAVEQGDHARAEWFATRLLGKVNDKVELTLPKPFVITRQNGEQVVLGAKVEETEES